jgi:hypothetical protein
MYALRQGNGIHNPPQGFLPGFPGDIPENPAEANGIREEDGFRSLPFSIG